MSLRLTHRTILHVQRCCPLSVQKIQESHHKQPPPDLLSTISLLDHNVQVTATLVSRYTSPVSSDGRDQSLIGGEVLFPHKKGMNVMITTGRGV